MRLPNAERAVVDISKLADYCLSLSHARGKHKARVFATVLGFTRDDADLLRDALIKAAREKEAIVGERDDYGQRYVLDFEMVGPAGRGIIRSNWIVRSGEDFPRLTSCYVL